ncbi:hypothetical protein NM208_g7775 [Fusarium decemcellulare]|uniref:Uncharacterized protein n=1 Tax=Fusarium decemcellulare TaxID=57161 RepID=A0ACC1S7V4_9HYPO|nr:hypothetical protein NM208_g7775 [Fusarium decemcellulare]
MSAIEHFPVDVIITIMAAVESPLDLKSFMSAFPSAQTLFKTAPRTILQASVEWFEETLGNDLLRMAVLSCRLSGLRNRATPPRREAMECQIRPVLQDYEASCNGQPDERWHTDFSFLCELQRYVSDTDAIVTEYAPKAWRRTEEAVLGLHVKPPRFGDGLFSDLYLTASERNRFREAIFRYDSFCYAFVHGRQILFDHDDYFRRLMIRPFCTEDADKETGAVVKNMRAIEENLFQIHRSITIDVCRKLTSGRWDLGELSYGGKWQPYDREKLSNLNRSMRRSVLRSGSDHEAADPALTGTVAKQLSTLVERDGQIPAWRKNYRPELIWLATDNLNSSTRRYTDVLCVQGHRLLLDLERLDERQLIDFTLSNFYLVSGSPVRLPYLHLAELVEDMFPGSFEWRYARPIDYRWSETRKEGCFWDAERIADLEKLRRDLDTGLERSLGPFWWH